MSRDRFTEKDENGKWMAEMLPHERRFYIHRCDRTNEIDKDYLYGPAIERLAEYEDTGLSPEEIKELLHDSTGPLHQKLGKWIDAERDGRLIILPVKEGTPLFVDGKIFASHCQGQVHKVTDWYYSYPMIYKDFRGEHDYVIDPDGIGTSTFLTREEAEAALKERYGKHE